MKVLIIAYDFPPLISIGALRPYSWYKYLPEFGVDVTVVTRDWEHDEGVKATDMATGGENRKIVKARFLPGFKQMVAKLVLANRFKVTRQAVTYLFSFLEYLSLKFDPGAAIYYEADMILTNEKFDFIIATGKPFILLRYASLLSKKHNTPWVADYRDSWTLNHIQSDYTHSLLNSVLNTFYTWMEKKYVSTASLITTVAPSYINYLPAYLHHIKKGIVYNGYDDEIEPITDRIPVSTSKFIISYAGIIYPMQRLELFLEAVAIFLTQNSVLPEEFEIHFWGVKNEGNVVSRIMNYNAILHPYVHFHPKVGYFEVMEKLRPSNLLLLLTTGADGWLNAKLFDYLVLKRPVLMLGNRTNVMADILKETNGGVVAEDATTGARYILEQFERYKSAIPNNTLNYKQYSRKNQAEQLYLMLKNQRVS